MLPLIQYPNPILRKKAQNIPAITPEIKELGLRMTEAMRRYQGVGLAGPQVGVSLRIIAVQDEKDVLVCVNPQILEASKEQEIQEEGCLSLPGIYLPVKRPKEIKVRYIDLQGNAVERLARGLVARIFQHEIDHINGRLIINRVGIWRRLRLGKQLRKISRGAIGNL